MNQIEVVERIIKNNGECYGDRDDAGCDICPAKECSRLWNFKIDKKLDWFKNWLSENKKQENVMEKIQMTEEQAIQMINDCNLSGFILATLRNAGYIRKSELQQKVEEAEEMYHVTIYNPSQIPTESSLYSLCERQHEAIQLFKEKYPDFKND